MACSELKPLKWMCCCGSKSESTCKCGPTFSINSIEYVGRKYPTQIKIEAEPIIKKEKTKFIKVPKVQ